MPATVTLSTTTLTGELDRSQGTVQLASTSGVVKGTRLYVDGEMMEAISVGVDGTKVRRGVDGTAGVPHASGVTVYIGEAHQFFQKDPVGRPPAELHVSPHINVVNGTVWFAQGDASNTSARWWQKQTTTYGVGALGVRTATVDLSTSS